MGMISRGAEARSVSKDGAGLFAVWNRRLLIAATVVMLWLVTVLALQAAGPGAQALLAGEGLLINPPAAE